jgi:hypothetical protein
MAGLLIGGQWVALAAKAGLTNWLALQTLSLCPPSCNVGRQFFTTSGTNFFIIYDNTSDDMLFAMWTVSAAGNK